MRKKFNTLLILATFYNLWIIYDDIFRTQSILFSYEAHIIFLLFYYLFSLWVVFSYKQFLSRAKNLEIEMFVFKSCYFSYILYAFSYTIIGFVNIYNLIILNISSQS